MGCVEYWRWLHVELHPTHSSCRRIRTALVRCNACYAVVADEAGKALWEGRPAGWGGGQGQVEGRVGRRAGWLEGMDPWSKECLST